MDDYQSRAFDIRSRFFYTPYAALLLALSLPVAASDQQALSQQLINSITQHSNGRGLQAFRMPDKNDLDSIPQDPNNPITRAKVTLGRFLYHETAIGTEGTDPERTESWSCASCHHVAAGFKAGVPQGIGDGGVGFGSDGTERRLKEGLDATAPAGDMSLPDLQPLTSPTVLNTAYQDLMLWNGSFGNASGGVNAMVTTVDEAGPAPIKANTFGLSGLETQVLAGTRVHRLRFDDPTVLQSNSEYRYLYKKAYPDGDTGTIPDNDTEVTPVALGAAKAIAAYERTILSNFAPFQKWLGGDQGAMTQQQLRGANLFFGKADCASCHTGPALSSDVEATSEEMFFAIGFNDFDTTHPQIHGTVDDATSRGRGGFTNDPADDYKFKIPQLYNLTDTNVFGHGASFSSVREVIEYKNAAVTQNQAAVNNLSNKFAPLNLDDLEIDDLVVFIEEALHDNWLDRYVPKHLPSGACFPVADMQSALDLGCYVGGTETEETYGNPVCEYANSDPDGDGWGWESNASCLMSDQGSTGEVEPSTGEHPICRSASSDSDNDGWGWENSRSCIVSG